MLATLERPMSKAARSGDGTPKKSKWTVKLNDDVGEMVSWIVKLKGGTMASYLDPIIRERVKEDYKDVAREVETIKKAQAKHRPTGEAASD